MIWFPSDELGLGDLAAAVIVLAVFVAALRILPPRGGHEPVSRWAVNRLRQRNERR